MTRPERGGTGDVVALSRRLERPIRIPMRYSTCFTLTLATLVGAAAPARGERPAPGALDRVFGAGATPQGEAQTHRATDLPLAAGGLDRERTAWLRAFAPAASAAEAGAGAAAPEPFEYTTQFVREEDGIGVYRLTYPSPLATRWPENNVVPAEYFVPTGAPPAGGRAAAIFLDIKAGNAIVPRMLARAAARRGLAAVYVPMPGYGARRPAGDYQRALDADPKLVVESIRQTVMDVRRAKAILAARPDVDGARVGICGVSLGGIMAALAAGVDGEFHRVVLILAGGDLATIAFDENRETRRLRAALIASGLDRAAAAELFAPVEPLHFAGRIGAGRCLMINALHDEIIPRPTTEALRAAIGDPTILWLPAGHYSAVTYFLTMQGRAMDFLAGGGPDRPALNGAGLGEPTAGKPAR
jgi:dienelactone hydrolase